MTLFEEQFVKVSSEGSISEIIVNRPDSLNALNPDLLQSLIRVFERIAKDESCRAIIITGAGSKAFVAGADIHTMSQLGPRPIAEYVELGQRAMRSIESAAVPVIAAVNGYALGGGMELALACDLIIACDTAKMGQPEVNLGIIPGFGGTQRLMQRCGIGLTRRLCYTGDLLSAQEALQVGLIDKVSTPEALMADARAVAQTIASKAPLAVQGVKEVIRRSQEQQLLSGLRLEVEKFLELFSSVDREEGMGAFLQKRKPTFIGK